MPHISLPGPDGLQIALTLVTLALGIIALRKAINAGAWLKAKWNRWVGFFQTIAGRDPIVDKITGKELSPEVPALGLQIAAINDNMAQLIEVVKSNQDAHHRIDSHELRLNDHDSSIAALVASTFERGADSALRAAEKTNADVIDVDADEQ